MRILDGAVATELARAGFALQAPSFAIAANEQAPQLVSHLYQSYLDAGAQTLTLNSFGLSGGIEQTAPDFGPALAQRAQTAWDLAKPFAGQSTVWGALSLGIGEDPGKRLLAESQALIEAGLAHLRFETLCDLDGLIEAQTALLALLNERKTALTLSLCPAKKTLTELLQALETSDWLSYPGLRAIGINCVNCRDLGTAVTELAAWSRPPARFETLGIELRPHLSGISDSGEWQTHAIDPATLVQRTKAMLAPLPEQLKARIALGTCCGGGASHVQALNQAFGPCRSRAKNPPRG